MKRKIGIVSEYFYPHLGGITEHVYHLSLGLLKKGFEPVILTGFDGQEPGIEIPDGLRIIRVGDSVPIFSNGSFAKVTIGWNLGKKIKRILAEEKFDLLHIHSPTMMVLPALFQKYSETVNIGTLHTYFDSNLFYKLLQKQCQSYLDHLDGIISVSPSCVEAMSRYFTLKNTIQIPNGVDTEWFGNPSGKIEKFAQGSQNILFLGRLDPRNGLDILIRAFPKVLERVPNAKLIITGDGPMRPLYETMVESLPNDLKDKNIFFEGEISTSRPNYFATSDVFCYPATKASFGITLLESMSAGVPVVASNNKGFRDLIRDGVTGLLSEQESEDSLAATLVKVLTDKQLAASLRKEGLKMAQEYAWPKVTDRIIAYYDQVYRAKKGEAFAR